MDFCISACHYNFDIHTTLEQTIFSGISEPNHPQAYHKAQKATSTRQSKPNRDQIASCATIKSKIPPPSLERRPAADVTGKRPISTRQETSTKCFSNQLLRKPPRGQITKSGNHGIFLQKPSKCCPSPARGRCNHDVQ